MNPTNVLVTSTGKICEIDLSKVPEKPEYPKTLAKSVHFGQLEWMKYHELMAVYNKALTAAKLQAEKEGEFEDQAWAQSLLPDSAFSHERRRGGLLSGIYSVVLPEREKVRQSTLGNVCWVDIDNSLPGYEYRTVIRFKANSEAEEKSDGMYPQILINGDNTFNVGYNTALLDLQHFALEKLDADSTMAIIDEITELMNAKKQVDWDKLKIEVTPVHPLSVEITDEEIERFIDSEYPFTDKQDHVRVSQRRCFKEGAKWYRSRLKGGDKI